MKKIAVFLVLIMSVLSFASCKEKKPSYSAFVEELKTKNPDLHYIIKDIDKNSSDELIVLKNTAITVYTSSDKISKLDSYDFYTGTTRLFLSDKKDFPGIFYFCCGGGVNHFGVVNIENNKLVSSPIFEEDYSGILGEKGKIYELCENKALIEESKRLYNENKDIKFS